MAEESKKKPFIYEDDFLKYDEVWNMYVLTEEAVKPFVNFRARITDTSESVDRDIYNTLLHISQMVYSLIHENPLRAEENDRIVVIDTQARNIVKRALLAQAEYVLGIGDLSFSSNAEDRTRAIAPSVRNILLTPIKRIGRSLLYMGV